MAEPLTQTILEKPIHGAAALRRLRAVLPEEVRTGRHKARLEAIGARRPSRESIR